MKKVVLLKDLAASDISYSSLYEEYVNLLEKDIDQHFEKRSAFVDVSCPGCGKKDNPDIFRKLGMNFQLCAKCGSYYVNPRPDRISLDNFYRHSKACIFWREQSINLPRNKLWNLHSARVNWILELTDEFLDGPLSFMDFETKYSYLIEQIRLTKIFNPVFAYKPRLYEQEGLVADSILTEHNSDRYCGDLSMITAFESLERMFNPKDLFDMASKWCVKGGLLLITTASCSGFEYQVLGESAPNINPINRMNLLSFEALTAQVEAAGFEIVESSTPGRLDVEIVRQALERRDDVQIHPFWKYVFDFRDEQTWRDLQQFLQLNRLSSHVRIAAIKG